MRVSPIVRNGTTMKKASSVVSRLKTGVICERRRTGCESPRRDDAGTSLRSGGEADGPPPPQSTPVFKRDTTLVVFPAMPGVGGDNDECGGQVDVAPEAGHGRLWRSMGDAQPVDMK